MKRTNLKIFFIIFLMIFLPFFGLIEFQKMTQQREMQMFENDIFQEEYFTPPPMQEPPSEIPLIVMAIFSSVLTLLFVKYLAKNFINPLGELQNKIKQIGEGNFDVDLKAEKYNPTIKTTFNTLNNMATSLKEKQCLQESFIQGLTHDLRAPALVQDRVISILEDELGNNELVDLLKNNNENYLKLINLIIENYNSTEEIMNKTTFNLKQVINGIYNVLKPVFREKNLKFNTEITDESQIYADYSAINRILLNLISNAVEEIDNNKEISVTSKETDDSFIISVEDNGNGIAPDFIPYIFEKNASLHQTGQKAVRGLGLSICKKLTEQMNGKIRVESEFAKYTKFIIELPKDSQNE